MPVEPRFIKYYVAISFIICRFEVYYSTAMLCGRVTITEYDLYTGSTIDVTRVEYRLTKLWKCARKNV